MIQRRFANNARSFFVRNNICVENQMIKQWIIQFFAEISPHIALTPEVLFANEFQGCFLADCLNLPDVLDASFQRSHQSDMKSVFQFASDDVGPASNQNNVSCLGEMQNGKGRLMHQCPIWWVQAE